MKKIKFIFAGGGTGGHLFPGLAIAQEISAIEKESEIIFIGNKDKIEGRVVPKYGYGFRHINISGFSRKMNISNMIFPFKLFVSILKSAGIILKFKPDVVIGTGGYVSGPVLYTASLFGFKTVLQDHNSYPGITTRLLAGKAKEIHLAFDEARKYFKKEDNLILSGFPVRSSFKKIEKQKAIEFFGLKADRPVLFITGGSQGAKKINDELISIIDKLLSDGIQIIWQTGSIQYKEISEKFKNPSLKIYEFLNEMDYAYSVCDLAITRAGATTIGELIRMETPAILIPLPTAAEDHQTKNAKSLCDENAAIMLAEKGLEGNLFDLVIRTVKDPEKMETIKSNLRRIQINDSANKIAQSIINLAKNKN